MTDGDREKLAREMRVVLGLSESSYSPSPHDCADIAIAYADRRVAEAVEQCIAAARESLAHCGPDGKFILGPLVDRAVRSALSPAREGGGDE